MAIDFNRKMNKFIFTMIQLSSSEKAIENDTSGHLLAARHELVKCYSLGLEVLSRALQQQQDQQTKKVAQLVFRRAFELDLLDEFLGQCENFESVMRIGYLQGPSSTPAASEMLPELLKQMRKEIREGFQNLDDDMQKRMADLEHRVVASIRDALPGIIRDEMRKCLDEQRKDVNT